MSYTSSSHFPVERASKIGHIKIIQEPHIQRWINAFEKVDTDSETTLGELSGKLDLSQVGMLENIVAIDGSHVAVPNAIYSHKRIAFITASAIVLGRSEVTAMKTNPILDPRDMAKQLQRSTKSMAAVLPLSGVSLPGETVVDSIRRTIDETLHVEGLYDTSQFLVSREWLTEYTVEEHMQCVKCGEEFFLTRFARRFRCPRCYHYNTLSDYVGIVQSPPEDWAKEEGAISLRTIMETLLLMSFLKLYAHRPIILKRTLFVKDGPLLLRAQLSRLIEPIRAFLKYLKDIGRDIHIVGVEKTGDLVEHIPQIKNSLKEPGDYFLPTVQYLQERIHGVPYVEAVYRNRVQYGSKVIVRLSPNHIVVFNIPTGEFLTAPKEFDLYGFQQSMALLSEMVSYSYENALIPLVLANSAASISMKPSSDILETFAKRLLGE
jgi:ribosomal protein S27AE